MSKSEFDEFVKRQNSEQPDFDPKQLLDEWLGDLEALYRNITSYLQTYIDSSDAQIEYQNVQLNEDFSGPYIACKLILKIGRAAVTFTPIGTMLVGSKGRVDVQGPSGTARLVLISKLATTARSLIRVTIRGADDPPPPPPSPDEAKSPRRRQR
jgi:hypothetical protein